MDTEVLKTKQRESCIPHHLLLNMEDGEVLAVGLSSGPCACQRKDPDSLGVWGEPKESDEQRRASVVPSGLTPCRAQASGLQGHLHRDQATAFRPRVAHGTSGLGIAASHLTGGCIAAYSSPGLEAEESAHSIGNHH